MPPRPPPGEMRANPLTCNAMARVELLDSQHRQGQYSSRWLFGLGGNLCREVQLTTHNGHEALEALVNAIVDVAHPLRIIVFGSAARGTAGPTSDIDLLIVMPEGTHRRKTAQDLYQRIRGIGVPFDLLVATPGDLEKHRDNIGLIYRTILAEGKEVYAA